MNREILFRGKIKEIPSYIKDKQIGDWIYGSHLSYPIAQIIDLEDEYIVDPDTVGQFTGITDDNERKIFEGDVVWYGWGDHGSLGWEHSGTVVVDMSNFHDLNMLTESHSLEVIGNIYDNPELIDAGGVSQ